MSDVVLVVLPVSSYLNIKGHLDIEKILVLFKVSRHFALSGSKFILKLADCILQERMGVKIMV